MSGIPEIVRRRADQLLETYIREHAGRLTCPHVVLEYAWQEDCIVLTCRDGCNPPRPVARFCYATALHQWFLFAPDDTAGGWRPCLELRPTLALERHLQHLDDDPFNRFWPPSFTCFS